MNLDERSKKILDKQKTIPIEIRIFDIFPDEKEPEVGQDAGDFVLNGRRILTNKIIRNHPLHAMDDEGNFKTNLLTTFNIVQQALVIGKTVEVKPITKEVLVHGDSGESEEV